MTLTFAFLSRFYRAQQPQPDRFDLRLSNLERYRAAALPRIQLFKTLPERPVA